MGGEGVASQGKKGWRPREGGKGKGVATQGFVGERNDA
jgi:hypothetical protein